MAQLEHDKYVMAYVHLPSVLQVDCSESTCVRRGPCETPRTPHGPNCAIKSTYTQAAHAPWDHARRSADRLGRSWHRGWSRCGNNCSPVTLQGTRLGLRAVQVVALNQLVPPARCAVQAGPGGARAEGLAVRGDRGRWCRGHWGGG